MCIFSQARSQLLAILTVYFRATALVAEDEAASAGYPGGVSPYRQSESPAAPYPVFVLRDRRRLILGNPRHEHPAVWRELRIRRRESPAQPDDLRRQNGARSHARHGGTGEASRAARQAYPQDGYQGSSTGSRPRRQK